MRFFLWLFAFWLVFALSFSQQKKRVEAIRISSPLLIDAVLDEEVYGRAVPAKDFVQLQPYNGQPSFQPSEVFFFFDEHAVYVGAILRDSKPDSIYNFLTQRDNIGMSDYFGVYFDPYNSGLVSYGFFITPAGVQTDIKAAKNDGDKEDGNWNAVWESKTRITDEGWMVEMRIPFSALRFSEKTGEAWGLNMFRNIRRYNSNNSWSLVDRKVSGFIHQQGELVGIKDVKPPVRLSFSPYLATYYEPQNAQTKALFKGGLDLKYGISDAFTLDMMLIPDFGQIQSDDHELNLSPYEIRYNEKRQFFTEGTELFQRAGVFYSRRIGSKPVFAGNIVKGDHETVTYNPSETQLINATKISGRTNKGLGIGLLNAMALESKAVVLDESTGVQREIQVQPFSNYSVMVVDQSLKNNSFISLINTNVSMVGHPFSANVTATQFEFRDKSKTYALKGMGGYSARGSETKERGFFGNVSLEKNKGKFFWGLEQELYSDKYNPNDLGYLQHNNFVTSTAWIYYQMVEPRWIFREWNADIWYNYNRLFQPSVFVDNEAGFDFNARFKNNFSLSTEAKLTGRKNDYFEPRVAGRYYIAPFLYDIELNLTTDFRKPVHFQLSYQYKHQPETKMDFRQYAIETVWRAGQRLNVDFLFGIQERSGEYGFAALPDDGSILFAQRNVSTILNTLETTYVINNKMGLSFRARHYWSAVANQNFFKLNNDGTLSEAANSQNQSDQNYNAFTIDMVYRWIFMPGSELSVAWKTNTYMNTGTPEYFYLKNLTDSWQNQTNSISLKVLYYLDFNSLRKKG
jgi:hypothetical protein